MRLDQSYHAAEVAGEERRLRQIHLGRHDVSRALQALRPMDHVLAGAKRPLEGAPHRIVRGLVDPDLQVLVELVERLVQGFRALQSFIALVHLAEWRISGAQGDVNLSPPAPALGALVELLRRGERHFEELRGFVVGGMRVGLGAGLPGKVDRLLPQAA